jgi:hydroxyacylglutathione hydrolase
MVPGNNNSIFPFCTCLYLKGKEMRVLIDAGMGRAGMEACVKMGIDVLILTHCHYDHRSTIGMIADVPVWCHKTEVPFIENNDLFFNSVGLSRSGLDYMKIFKNLHLQNTRISKTVRGLDKISLGGLDIEVLHVPGHTPGHIAFHEPKADFLFTADVSLHPFGPFYGHDFADIDDTIHSIQRLKKIGASTVLSSHCGPFTDEADRRFSEYEEIIYTRDRLLLDMLDRPRPIDYFLNKGVVYANTSGILPMMTWFEKIHIEKHFERLIKMKLLKKEGELYLKI